MQRRFGIASIALFALLMLFAAACAPYVTPQGAAPLRYRDDVFSNVTKTSDVTYGSAPDSLGNVQTLKLDIYQPAGDTVAARPAIVWIHGGSFCCGSKTSPEIVAEANAFAKKGYFNVSIDYRLRPGCSAGTPAACVAAIIDAQHDAQAAVRFLRANASKYHIDAHRIATAGTSAGAITAFQVAYNANDPGTSGNPGQPSDVRAAVSWSGAFIIGKIDPGEPPGLDFHGTNDPLVPYAWIQNTVKDGQAAGVPIYVTTYQGEGHVPPHLDQVLAQTRNFLYVELDAAHAAR
jgi:acetyl esterase/lipase